MRFIPISAPSDDWRGGGTIVISVPGENVSALQCDLPAGLKDRKARGVALNAVQDLIAGAAEEQSFVVVPGSGASRTVLVTGKSDLEGWIAARAKNKSRAAVMLPDYLCLPWTPNTVTVAIDGADRLLVRNGPATGVAGERAMVLKMLERMRAQQSEGIEAICLHPGDAQRDSALMSEVAKWNVPLRPPPGKLNLPNATLLSGAASNASASARVRAYASVLAASVVAVGFWAANALIETRQAEHAAEVQSQENIAVGRSEFGLEGPIIDMRIQVDRAVQALRLSQAQGAPNLGFPELLGKAGPVLADPEIDVSELRYRDHALVSVVRVADFAALETLRGKLSSPGLSAEITSSLGGGTDGVRAEIRLVQSGRGR